MEEAIHDHYPDDFLFLGIPDSPDCASYLLVTQTMCESLGVSVAHDKIEGPTAALTFLVIIASA